LEPYRALRESTEVCTEELGGISDPAGAAGGRAGNGAKDASAGSIRNFVKHGTFGYDLDAPADEKYLTIVKLAEGRLGDDELADWIRRHLRA